MEGNNCFSLPSPNSVSEYNPTAETNNPQILIHLYSYLFYVPFSFFPPFNPSNRYLMRTTY